MDKPLVSIIINNYNYGRFLRDAIDSALNQTYPNVEVIVVDDGSSDNSRDIISEYAAAGKIVPVLKDNGGQASAFNAGFEVSRGDVICLLDSDDVFLPHKVDRVVNLFTLHNEAAWLVHVINWSFPDGMTRPAFLYEQPTQLQDYRKDLARGKLRAKLPATSGLCLRRSLLQQILPMPEEIRIAADNYIKFAAAALEPVLLVNEPLAIQRIHGANAYTLSHRLTPMAIKANLDIARNLKMRFPDTAAFSYRLAAHYVARSLSELGILRGIGYARTASQALGFPSVSYGSLRILARASLVMIRNKLCVLTHFGGR